MNDIAKIAGAIRRHGLHKMAAGVLRADGVPVPTDWSMPEIAFSLGTKMAADRLAHQSIMAGLGSLYEVAGELGEKRASDSLFHEFSRVKIFAERLDKVASEHLQADIVACELGFWQRCKTAAANDEDGLLLGLAKIAVSFFGETVAAGEKTASSPEEVVQFAASFACAAVVDDALARMLKAAEITAGEAQYLARLNAQAAFNDLSVITRTGD